MACPTRTTRKETERKFAVLASSFSSSQTPSSTMSQSQAVNENVHVQVHAHEAMSMHYARAVSTYVMLRSYALTSIRCLSWRVLLRPLAISYRPSPGVFIFCSNVILLISSFISAARSSTPLVCSAAGVFDSRRQTAPESRAHAHAASMPRSSSLVCEILDSMLCTLAVRRDARSAASISKPIPMRH